MDADLQDEPEQLPRCSSKLDEGSDVVYTVNVDDGGRRQLAPHLRALSLLVLEGRAASTCRSRSAPTAPSIGSSARRCLSYPERRPLYGPLMLYMGFTAAFVPVRRAAERGGRSGYTFFKRLGLAVDTLVSYTNVPHRILLVPRLGADGSEARSTLSSSSSTTSFAARSSRAAHAAPRRHAAPDGRRLAQPRDLGSYVFRVFEEVLGRPRYLLADSIDAEPLGGSPNGLSEVTSLGDPTDS